MLMSQIQTLRLSQSPTKPLCVSASLQVGMPQDDTTLPASNEKTAPPRGKQRRPRPHEQGRLPVSEISLPELTSQRCDESHRRCELMVE